METMHLKGCSVLIHCLQCASIVCWCHASLLHLPARVGGISRRAELSAALNRISISQSWVPAGQGDQL